MINYQIINYNESIKNKFFEFCMECSFETEHKAALNMWCADWQKNSNTLPYVLTYTNRFQDPKGTFSLIDNDGVIVGCSGIYISDFSNEVAIAGVRTWLSKDHRHLGIIREFILPFQKKWAVDKKCKIVLLSFNDYNKNMINMWKRRRLGETRSKRQPHHLFYNGLHEIPFPVTIQHTKQWAIYEKLSDWDYDWEQIRW